MKLNRTALTALMFLASSVPVWSLRQDTPRPQAEASAEPLQGKADALKIIPPHALLDYMLQQKDLTTLFTQERNRVRPLVIRSMIANRAFIVLNGTVPGDTIYTTRWTVVGETVEKPGLYVDSWLFYSDSDPLDKRSQQVNQVVHIVSKQGGNPPPLPDNYFHDPPEMKFKAPAKTELETLSDALMPDVRRLMTAQQRLDLADGDAIEIPLKSLPAALLPRAIKYIQVASRSLKGSDVPLTPQEDTCSLVVLPPPSTVLGVDSAPSMDGTILHF